MPGGVFVDEAAMLAATSFAIQPDDLVRLAKEGLRLGAGPLQHLTLNTTTLAFHINLLRLKREPHAYVGQFHRSRMSATDPPPHPLTHTHCLLLAGVDDPSILADSFEFCAPFVGPIDKEEYLGALGKFKVRSGTVVLQHRLYNASYFTGRHS